MVGGSSSASPHTPVGFNYGNRLDCYAWGQNIDTTSTNGNGTDNTAYTAFFGGTSGASPIVVGAALIVQGIAQASLGYRFSPRELREILKIGGTPSANPDVDRIGVMPNLNAIITGDQINLAPDLYLRDYVGDDGNPTSGFISTSPDIIVRQTAVADPQLEFGAGSGTENDPALSDDVGTGNHSIYVRTLNRGGSAATDASVDVYWSQPATLVTPSLWTLIGSATLASVPTGNVLAVSDAVTWLSGDIPAPGHYCFVGVAGNAQDPKPDPTAFGTFANYLTYIENNNNVVWRNFDVVPPPASAGPQKLKFFVAGAFDTGHRFELETVGRLPAKSRVFLNVPAWLADAMRPHPVDVTYDAKRHSARIPIHAAGVQRLGSAVLHARCQAQCLLHVQIPKEAWGYDYDFAIRQLCKQKEVGRITWRFSTGDKRGPQKKAASRWMAKTRK